MDEAHQEASKMLKIDREYLSLLFKLLIHKRHSLEDWMDHKVLNSGEMYKEKTNTILYFTYLDCKLNDKASLLLQVCESLFLSHLC